MRVTNLTCWLQPSMLLSKRFASLPRAITSSSKRMMASSIWSPRLRLSTWTYSTKPTSETSHILSDLIIWEIRIHCHMIISQDNCTPSKIWDLIMITTKWDLWRLIGTIRGLQLTQISEARTPKTWTREIQWGHSLTLKDTSQILARPLNVIMKAPEILKSGSILIPHQERDPTSA